MDFEMDVSGWTAQPRVGCKRKAEVTAALAGDEQYAEVARCGLLRPAIGCSGPKPRNHVYRREREGRRAATLRRRFYARQQKQRALYTALRELCGGRPPSKCVLLWGNGSFRPSVFRGHPSAPNKALYEFFARFMAVIIVDERGTSKYSPCCDKKVRRPCHSGDRKGRVHGMGYCTGCGQRWSRDAGAAVKMRDRFLKKCGVSLTCPLNAPSGA